MSKIPSTFPREGDARCTGCGHHPSMCCCGGRWDATRVKDQKALAAHPERDVNLDTLRAKAEAAKAWRPVSACVNAVLEVGSFRCSEGKDIYDAEDDDGTFCSVPVPVSEWCSACLGAQRAAEDIERHVNEAMNRKRRSDKVAGTNAGLKSLQMALHEARVAARIASYFAAEPNPVSEFRDAVKEAVK